MTGLPWFKCYPRDFNKGMERLTLEERGAYVTLLNLIYENGAPIPDDAWWASSKLACTKRTWVKIRAALIIKGRLFALSFNGEDCLMDERAAQEIETHAEISRKFSEAGKKGGQKSRPKSNKNNDDEQARLPPSLSQVEPRQSTESDTDITDDDSASARFADWDGEDLDRLEGLLREAAGSAVNATSATLCIVAPVLGLLRPGAGPACDLKLDVLPAIRAAAPKVRRPVDRWDYFAPMIAEARDRRLQGAPAVGEVVPLRATGPPSFTDQIAANNAEARRIAFEMLDRKNG
jgi:uncharacterized protein YdaU (DUF1376 family)